MRLNKNPNKNTILFTGIAENMDSRRFINSHVFVYTPEGKSFYIVGNARINAAKFERVHLRPLIPNKISKGDGKDGRTNFY